MKTKIKLMLVGILAIVLTSCSEDVLDRSSITYLSYDGVYEGTFQGSFSGEFNAVVINGEIEGTLDNIGDPFYDTFRGEIIDGSFESSGEVNTGAIFNGEIDSSGHVEGTWTNGSYSGIFNGNKI